MNEIEFQEISVPDNQDIIQTDAQNDAAIAARELLKNGILVETNKG